MADPLRCLVVGPVIATLAGALLMWHAAADTQAATPTTTTTASTTTASTTTASTITTSATTTTTTAASTTPTTAAAAGAALRREAMELAYNLDRPQAIAFLEEAVRLEPAHPANHRLLATLAWLRLLWDRGAVTVDDYLGTLATKDVTLPKAGARASAIESLTASYRQHLAVARQLAERRLAEQPDAADALYEAGAVYGLETSYHASIEGRMVRSFGTARKAHGTLVRALARDPRRHDAGYYIGSYRCLVAELPKPMRWIAFLGGLRANKPEGLALIEAAARHPGEAQGQARYTLVLFYNRDGRYADALRLLDDVRQLYPRNRQFVYETAATRLRAGQASAALDLFNEGVERLRTDPRPRWYGEEAQWHYKRALALHALDRDDDARRDLETAATFDAPAWIREDIARTLALQRSVSRPSSNAPRAFAR